jgi:hypothetical protein
MVGDDAIGRLLVTAISMGGRDVKVKCGLLPPLTAGVGLLDCTDMEPCSLYLNKILLWNGGQGLLGDKGEGGLVCPAETGLLATAGGAQGWLLSHQSISSDDICSSCCSAMGMGKS